VFNIYISLYRLGEEAELRRSTLLKLYYNRLLSHSPAIVTGFVMDCWVRTALQQTKIMAKQIEELHWKILKS
ncbi:hypothetical protein GIB67_029548, partial [Kingdonia uniflora]